VIALKSVYGTEEWELRRVEEAMIPGIYDVLESERERLQAHMPWTTKIHSEEDLLRLMVTDRAGETRFDYALYTETLGFCGCLSVIDLQWAHRQCRLQYWLREEAVGKGLMGKALSVFEQAIFEAGIHRIEILCQEVNPRSVKFAERLGYLKEGVMRDGVYHLGEFRNVVILGKVKNG